MAVGFFGGGSVRVGTRSDSRGSKLDIRTGRGRGEWSGTSSGRLNDATGERLRLGLVLHNFIITGAEKNVKLVVLRFGGFDGGCGSRVGERHDYGLDLGGLGKIGDDGDLVFEFVEVMLDGAGQVGGDLVFGEGLVEREIVAVEPGNGLVQARQFLANGFGLVGGGGVGVGLSSVGVGARLRVGVWFGVGV